MFFYLVVFNLFLCGVLGFLVFILSYYYGGVFFSKSSAFECGFNSFMNSSSVFSMPFFIISLLFLLFDVEIVIMSFPPFMGSYFLFCYWLVVYLVLVATCYEWKAGVLSWVSSL